MVGVLSDARPKRHARMRGRTGSCTIRQGVGKSQGRKIEGAERGLSLGYSFFFVIMRYLFLGTKSLMQR